MVLCFRVHVNGPVFQSVHDWSCVSEYDWSCVSECA